ncbi:hypothetical protein BA6E_102283 [Bacteroidales bacterium 6E]|nr:hypothetical protein BA6E_102283 [Bacteroidales bacterium 6E]
MAIIYTLFFGGLLKDIIGMIDDLDSRQNTQQESTILIEDENQTVLTEQSSSDKNESNILLDVVKLKFSDGTLLPLSEFPDPANGIGSNESINLKFSDVDNDGLRELFITYMEIGANCCLVTNMFEQVTSDVYQHIIQFDEGFGIDLVAGRIVMDFRHAYRYFHACGACYIDNELPSRSAASDITLVYKDNKLKPGSPDQALNDRIIKDLAYLSTREQPDDNNEYGDDGTRKAYGTLITSYYFNNDRNIEDTKAIFTEYYRNPDVNEIWNEIESTIKSFGI